MPGRPERGAQGPLGRLAKGGAAHLRWMLQHGPDDTPFPEEAAWPRAFARLHESAANFANRAPLPADPLEDLADHTGLLGEEVIARLAPAVVLGDGAGAIGRAAEHMDQPHPGRGECAPAVAVDKLGPFIFGHH